MTLDFWLDTERKPGGSSGWPSMVTVATASRELPFPTKYIVQFPNVDLLLALNVKTSPTPVKVAATTVVRSGRPLGWQKPASHTSSCSWIVVAEKAAPDRDFVSYVKRPSGTGAQPVSYESSPTAGLQV